MEDRVFAKPIKKQFEFDEEVASVFDDMIERSVPFYKESQSLVIKLLLANVPPNGRIYDLGTSTGSTLLHLWAKGGKEFELIGIDNSRAMIERARKKAKAYGAKIEFLESDILDFDFKEAQAFVANYTLQFIRPLKRERFVTTLYEKLDKDGVFIFSEKVISEDKKLDRQFIDIYFEYKRSQGYSEFEIAQKREALENVLVPFSVKENEEMLKNAGFDHVEIVFRWANFATFFARK